jgi:hypothetical protein
MYNHFNANPHLWAEHHAELKAKGVKFVEELSS